MLKLSGVIPHPAFDTSLLPRAPSDTSYYKTRGAAIQEKGGGGGQQQHYPDDYLESITPPSKHIDAARDVIGYAMYLAVSLYTSLMAWLWPFWIFDSYHLNFVAWLDSPREAIFFRRIILLEGFVWLHGLASAYVHQLYSIFSNTSQRSLINPMLGELESHRTHYAINSLALQPALPTRILLLITQAILLPIYFTACLVYPPICHSTARFLATLAVEMFTDAIKAADKATKTTTPLDTKDMPQLRKTRAPEIAKQFYGLSSNATLYDAVLNIRADDLFHAVFNDCVAEYHDQAINRISGYLGKPMKTQ